MKKIILLLSTIIITFILTGCYDYNYINDSAMIGAIAFDKEGNDYVVTIQIFYMQPAASSSSSSMGPAQPSTFSGRGKSIDRALANTALVIPRKLSFSHIQLIIIQESLAKQGMINILDFIMRHYESRLQFPIIISKEPTAGEILKVQTVIESFPVIKINKSLTIANKEHGISNQMNYDELISQLLQDGINPALPSIKITDKWSEEGKIDNIQYIEPISKLEIDTLGVFKKDKLLGWLDYDETIGYNLATGRLKSAVISVPCNSTATKYSSVRILRNKASINVDIKKGKPKIKADLKLQVRVTELECHLGNDNKEIIDKMEKLVNTEVKRIVEKAIIASQQKFNSDILGIGDSIYRKNPKYWKKNKDNWDKIYPTIDYEVKVDTNITRVGILDKTIFK
jgi:spore germination protein KC